MIEKLMAMKVAAELTHSVCGTFPTPGVDPANPGKVSDVIKSENLLEWEVFRIFYAAVCGAFSDDANWPPPVVQAAPTATAAGQAVGQAAGAALAPLLAGTGPLGQLIAALEPALAALAQKGVAAIPLPPAAPVPAPSSAPPTGGVSVGAQVKVGS